LIDAVRLVGLNGAYAGLGVGVVLAVGPLRRRLSTVDLVLLGYCVGFCLAGIVAAQLALVNALPGLWLNVAFASGSLAIGAGIARRRPRLPRGAAPTVAWGLPDSAILATALGVVGLTAVRFAGLPLGAWDGFAIWAAKARALQLWGGVSAPLFHDPAYVRTHMNYPLLLPSLEAGELRALGRVDGMLLHLELISLLAAFAAGLIVLLRLCGTSPATRAVIVVGVVASPAVLSNLATNYADVPLALFIALGLVTLGAWIVDADKTWLFLTWLFFSAAILTKNEGTLFVVAAFASAMTLRPAPGGHRRHLVAGAAATLAVGMPWAVFSAVNHLTDQDFSLAQLERPTFMLDRIDRITPAAGQLVHDITAWDIFWPAFALAAVIALFGGRTRQVRFIIVWTALSYLGLVTVYWASRLPIQEHLTNSAGRVVTSIAIGLFVFAAPLASTPRPSAQPTSPRPATA
jgi:hypothetical protein